LETGLKQVGDRLETGRNRLERGYETGYRIETAWRKYGGKIETG
jgi:hypothetical protein